MCIVCDISHVQTSIALLTWLVFQVMIITRLFIWARFLGSHRFPCQSLLNTTVLNDTKFTIVAGQILYPSAWADRMDMDMRNLIDTE